MNFKNYLLLIFLVFYTSKSWPLVILQQSNADKIEQLIKEADDLKYNKEGLGLSKVKEAEKLVLNLKSDKLLGEVYTMYGIYYYIAGAYDISLEFYLKAITIHEKYNSDTYIARSLNGVALIQTAFGQLEESIKTFEKCIKIDTKNKNYLGIARSYFNISIAQIELKQYEKATANLKKSFAFSKKNNVNRVNRMVENRLGDMMLIKNKPDSAFYYYRMALDNRNEEPNTWESAYAYAGLATTYMLNEDYDNAEINGLLSYEYAQKLNAKWDEARITKILSEIYQKKNNLDKAYKFLLINSGLQDSLYSEKKLNDVNYLQLKSKEVENLKLISKDAINAQKSKRDHIIIYSFLVLILFLVGILFLIKRNQRLQNVFNDELNLKNKSIERQKLLVSDQNKELISLNQTKNQLFSIVSHDLRSPIANILQILELQKDKSLTSEMQQEIFEQLHAQTEATSNMLNNLLQWANTQMDGQIVNFERINLFEIAKSVVELYQLEMDKKNISCSNQSMLKLHFINADAGQVRVIIQNILANAIKFTSEDGTINIHYSETENFINLHLSNSGAVIEQKRINEILNSEKRMSSEVGTSAEEGTGLGLLLVKQFLANNKGMLDIKSNDKERTEFIISFLKYLD